MDAIRYLIDQHDDMAALIEDLEREVDVSTRKALFADMADMLAAHATIEEQIFYPAVNAQQTLEMLLESTEEHLSIKRLLSDLLDVRVNDERFVAKLAVLKEQLDHHNREEEEKKLFPRVKKLLSAHDLQAIGGEMALLFERMVTQRPRDHVPTQTLHAAPIE